MRGLRELKKLLVLSLSSLSLFGGGFDYLNSENQNILNIQKEINSLQSKNLKRNWIEPIVASFTYTRGEKSETKYYKVSLSQPIFKSGGIYFAIKYAEANGKFISLATSLQENTLIKRVYELVLTLKKLDIQIAQVKLKLKNIEFDIKRKRERFLSGDDDISFLNQAMIERNSLSIKLEELKNSHKSLEKSFKNISPFSYKDVKLPKLKLVSQKEFLKKNLELEKYQADVGQQKELKNMTISNYLPTISLFGNYNYQKTKPKTSNKWQKDEFKNYGLMVSMPFSINETRDIQIRKLEAIKAKLTLSQKQRELKHEYESIYQDIEFLKNKDRVTRESLSLYNKLIKRTKDAVRAGDKTKLDLETIKNTKKSLSYDLKIIEYDKKLKILKLFEKMSRDLAHSNPTKF